mmetsp:Transcript_119617/g.339127  ORF Transcript_119617/g.339127 Transcript_119617/m.339127 type:complete len:235 (+) Transcript_119617:151-855(+)
MPRTSHGAASSLGLAFRLLRRLGRAPALLLVALAVPAPPVPALLAAALYQGRRARLLVLLGHLLQLLLHVLDLLEISQGLRSTHALRRTKQRADHGLLVLARVFLHLLQLALDRRQQPSILQVLPEHTVISRDPHILVRGRIAVLLHELSDNVELALPVLELLQQLLRRHLLQLLGAPAVHLVGPPVLPLALLAAIPECVAPAALFRGRLEAHDAWRRLVTLSGHHFDLLGPTT